MTTSTLEEFTADARRLLDDHYPRKHQRDEPFTWGAGWDRVAIFEETDPFVEAQRVADTRRWRSELSDAGYGWIDGPVELGGAGLAVSQRRAFETLVRGYDVVGNGLLAIGLGMVAPTILAHETSGAKQRYLGGLY